MRTSTTNFKRRARTPGRTVGENVCNNSKKRKKSCFLDFEKNVKNVKNVHIVSQATLSLSL